MTSKSPVRSAEDIDETALSYAEIKALATGNPQIKEKMDLDVSVSRLKILKANHLSQRYSLEDQILKELPRTIRALEARIKGYNEDIIRLSENTHPNKEGFSEMKVGDTVFTNKKEAGEAIIAACKAMRNSSCIRIGQYRGFFMALMFDTCAREYKITLGGELGHSVSLGTDAFGNIQRLDTALEALPDKLAICKEQLENAKIQLENAKIEVKKPFPQEEELAQKTKRLDELNIMLNIDKRDNEVVDDETPNEEQPDKIKKEIER